jgi:RNA-binding protein
MDSDFRAFLRNYGQTLPAVVMVGKNGYDDKVAAHLELALKTQELVKVKLQAHKDQAEEICRQLADKVGGTLVTRVGFNGLIYKESEARLMEKKYHDKA